MQTDSNLLFTGGNTGAAQAITSASVRSTGILDLATGLMNIGSTYSAAPLTIGNATSFSEELGNGFWRFRLAAFIGAAFAGGTSLNIQIQGAVDAAAGTYPANLSGLTWNTYAETGPIPTANLLAPAAGTNSEQGLIILPDWPHRMVKTNMPRFISLNYVPVGTFTAGSISLAGGFINLPDFDLQNYPSGYLVGA